MYSRNKPNDVIAKGSFPFQQLITKPQASIILNNKNNIMCSMLDITCQRHIDAYNIQFTLDCSNISNNYSSCCCFGSPKSLYLIIYPSLKQ